MGHHEKGTTVFAQRQKEMKDPASTVEPRNRTPKDSAFLPSVMTGAFCSWDEYRLIPYQRPYRTRYVRGFRFFPPRRSAGYPRGVKAIGSTPFGRPSTSRAAVGSKAAIQHVPSPSSVAARIRGS